MIDIGDVKTIQPNEKYVADITVVDEQYRHYFQVKPDGTVAVWREGSTAVTYPLERFGQQLDQDWIRRMVTGAVPAAAS